MGINQLSLFVRFFGGLFAIILSVVHEGKFSLVSNVPKLFRVLSLVKPTFTDFGAVWDEFRDLDSSEGQQLQELLAIELDIDLISDPDKKNLVKLAVNGALTLLELISKFKKP